MKFDNILQTIGATPIVRLNRFHDHLARKLWVEAESFNPGALIKDRPALDKTLLAILPDAGERYISTGLWSAKQPKGSAHLRRGEPRSRPVLVRLASWRCPKAQALLNAGSAFPRACSRLFAAKT